jgi:hypothetical protein
MKRVIKVGDTIYYECHDGTIDSAIVRDIQPKESNDWLPKKKIQYNWLRTSENSGIEDYNTLAPSNPKVRAYVKAKKVEMEANRTKMIEYVFGVGHKPTKKEINICERAALWGRLNYREE